MPTTKWFGKGGGMPSPNDIVTSMDILWYLLSLILSIVTFKIVFQEERLRGRGTETEESLQKRLTTARVEMDYGKYWYCCSIFKRMNLGHVCDELFSLF